MICIVHIDIIAIPQYNKLYIYIYIQICVVNIDIVEDLSLQFTIVHTEDWSP